MTFPKGLVDHYVERSTGRVFRSADMPVPMARPSFRPDMVMLLCVASLVLSGVVIWMHCH